jgi:hypothetical protein
MMMTQYLKYTARCEILCRTCWCILMIRKWSPVLAECVINANGMTKGQWPSATIVDASAIATLVFATGNTKVPDICCFCILFCLSMSSLNNNSRHVDGSCGFLQVSAVDTKGCICQMPILHRILQLQSLPAKI